jgi:hypothetical protein
MRREEHVHIGARAATEVVGVTTMLEALGSVARFNADNEIGMKILVVVV